MDKENFNEEFEKVRQDFKEDVLSSSFLNFDRMITPKIIQIIFWVNLVIVALVGLGLIIGGIRSYYGGGAMIFSGIMTLIFGPILVRDSCELIIVIFKIHDNLEEINFNTKK